MCSNEKETMLKYLLLNKIKTYILSRVRGSVTNNNGFWIWWLDLSVLLLQLQSIIIAHNQWLSKTCSVPYWTTSVFSSTVTDLVLIYESVTSSASVVRWLILHRWTLKWTIEPISELSYDWTKRFHELTNELSFITRGEPKRDHHLEMFVCYYLCLATFYSATEVLPLLTALSRECVYRTVV
jgi:hypothetical protein